MPNNIVLSMLNIPLDCGYQILMKGCTVTVVRPYFNILDAKMISEVTNATAEIKLVKWQRR